MKWSKYNNVDQLGPVREDYGLLQRAWDHLEWTNCFSVGWMFLGPATWRNGFAYFGYISVSTFDLLGPGQHSSQKYSDESKLKVLQWAIFV